MVFGEWFFPVLISTHELVILSLPCPSAERNKREVFGGCLASDHGQSTTSTLQYLRNQYQQVKLYNTIVATLKTYSIQISVSKKTPNPKCTPNHAILYDLLFHHCHHLSSPTIYHHYYRPQAMCHNLNG